MARELVPDELWKRIEPLLPAHPPRPKGGRRRLADRQVLTGIVFVLKTGIPWEDLPREMGCGSGMTCWRRLHEWTERGVWLFIRQHLHQWLGEAGRIDWERACCVAVATPSAVRARFCGRYCTVSDHPEIHSERISSQDCLVIVSREYQSQVRPTLTVQRL